MKKLKKVVAIMTTLSLMLGFAPVIQASDNEVTSNVIEEAEDGVPYMDDVDSSVEKTWTLTREEFKSNIKDSTYEFTYKFGLKYRSVLKVYNTCRAFENNFNGDCDVYISENENSLGNKIITTWADGTEKTNYIALEAGEYYCHVVITISNEYRQIKDNEIRDKITDSLKITATVVDKNVPTLTNNPVDSDYNMIELTNGVSKKGILTNYTSDTTQYFYALPIINNCDVMINVHGANILGQDANLNTYIYNDKGQLLEKNVTFNRSTVNLNIKAENTSYIIAKVLSDDTSSKRIVTISMRIENEQAPQPTVAPSEVTGSSIAVNTPAPSKTSQPAPTIAPITQPVITAQQSLPVVTTDISKKTMPLVKSVKLKGKVLTVKLSSKLKGVKVVFKINKKSYTGKTDKNGKAVIKKVVKKKAKKATLTLTKKGYQKRVVSVSL